MTGVPITLSPLVLVRQFFGSTVFDRRTSRYLPFDDEATALLVRLAGMSFDRVLSGAPTGEEAADLCAFFERFHRLGFFTIGGRFAGAILDTPAAGDHLTGPLAVHLEVVAACNLKCTHCFAGALPRREPALTLAEMDPLFATMARMGSFRLGLTGGEPTLRRDLCDILDLATGHGLHPCITTNGLLMTEDLARALGKRDLVWLNVSLDGATAASNDRVRGAGTFDAVLRNLEILARHARFTLAFTIMKHNAAEVRALAQLARTVGAHTVVLRPLYPVGTARHHLAELMPDFADYAGAVEDLARLEEEGDSELRMIDPFGPMSRAASQAVTHANHGCGAANTVCSVSVSGDVNPCSFLGSQYVADNVRRRPLDAIWHESEGFRAMRALSGDGPGAFRGGCRARALVLNGSVNASDPWVAHAGGVDPSAIVELQAAHAGVEHS